VHALCGRLQLRRRPYRATVREAVATVPETVRGTILKEFTLYYPIYPANPTTSATRAPSAACACSGLRAAQGSLVLLAVCRSQADAPPGDRLRCQPVGGYDR
jgi:hypothetical protein